MPEKISRHGNSMPEPKTIDLTPTWSGLYPALRDMVLYGTKEQREYVAGELKTLCQVADKWNRVAREEARTSHK